MNSLPLTLSAVAAAGLFARPSEVPREARYRAGGRPVSIAITDVNGDAKPDLLVANGGSGDVTVLLGDGTGRFHPATGSPFPAGPNPNDIAVGDFDGNRTPDLALPNHDTHGVTILLGDGRGAFRPSPGSPVRVQSRPHPHGVAAADFDGDGRFDLAVESWGVNSVEVLFGDGKGGFAAPGPLFPVGSMPYQRLRAADVNHDGRADILTTNFEGASVSVLLGDGKRGFASAPGSPFPAGRSPFSLAIADLDRDGHPDVAVANYSGQEADFSRDAVNVLLGDGKGAFRPMKGSPFAAGRAPVQIAAGDLTGDGVPELATANSAGNDVSVLASGAAGFSVIATVRGVSGPQGVAIGDLNGDGAGDLVVCASTGDEVVVVLGPFSNAKRAR